MGLYCAVVAVLAVLSTVAARKVRGGGGGGGLGGADSISYKAPPLETAALDAYHVFLLVSLIQLYIICRTLSHHRTRLPAIGATLALIILATGDGLGIWWFVNKWIIGGPTLSIAASIRLSVVFSLFYEWTDPAIFVAVALVLYSRYRNAVDKSSSIGLIASASAVGIIFVLMIALVVVDCAFFGSAKFVANQLNEDGIIPDEAHQKASARFWISNICYTAFVAFHIAGTILLAIGGFFVKAHTGNDTVTSATLFAIIPPIFLHAIARIVIAVFDARILRHGSTFDGGNALDFATIFVEGLMYAVAMSVLTFLLSRPHLWEKLPHSAPMGSSRSLMQAVPHVQNPGESGHPQQSV